MAFLKLNAGVGLGRVAICVRGMPTEIERVRTRRNAVGAGSRFRSRIGGPPGSPVPNPGIAVRIRKFRYVEDALDFGRLTALGGDCKIENSARAGLDPDRIDPHLNQPPPRTLKRLDVSELMCHVPHDLSSLLYT
jgi:hypothetical protein